MNYVDAIEQVLKHEGGFVNNPLDKGGATNWGITQRVYEAFKGRKVTIDEIKSMPKSEAIAIYKRNYWDAIGGDAIRFYSVAFSLFDQAVNRGVSAALKQAQSVLGLTPTGRLDPSFISSLNAIKEEKFLSDFVKASKDAYNAIVSKNPSQSIFLKGWLNRVTSLENYSLKNLGQLNTKTVVSGIALILGCFFLIYFLRRKK